MPLGFCVGWAKLIGWKLTGAVVVLVLDTKNGGRPPEGLTTFPGLLMPIGSWIGGWKIPIDGPIVDVPCWNIPSVGFVGQVRPTGGMLP
jgi:hypothetical protein